MSLPGTVATTTTPDPQQLMVNTASDISKISDSNFARSIISHSQRFMSNTATVYVAALMATHDPKIALISILMQWVCPTFGTPIPQDFSRVSESKNNRATDISSMARSAQITLVNPQPNAWIKPGEQYISTINLNTDYQSSDPTQNLRVSLQNSDGSPPPDWLSVNKGPLSYITSLMLGGIDIAYYIEEMGDVAIVVGQNALYTLDLRNRAAPVILSSIAYPAQSIPFTPSGFYVNDSIAIITIYNLYDASRVLPALVFNLTNPNNPILINTVAYGESSALSINNDTMYLTNINEIRSYNISNLLNITYKKSTYVTCSGPATSNNYNCYGFPLMGGYGYLLGQGRVVIFDITNPDNLVQVGLISCPTNQNANNPVTAAVEDEEFLYVGTDKYIFKYNNTIKTNPTLMQTIFLGTQASVSNLLLTEEYIVASCGEGGVVYVDIRDQQNAHVTTTYTTIGLAMDAVLIGNNVCLADGAAGFTVLGANIEDISATPGIGDEGEYNINIIAQDDAGDSISYPVTLNVGVQTIPPSVPFPLKSTEANVGAEFNLPIPDNTFSGTNLTLTTGSLPKWLKFDTKATTPNTIASFSGTPSSYDVNPFARTITIELYAENSAGRAPTTLNITLLGQSALQNFATVIGAIASIGGGLYTLHQYKGKI